MLSLIEELEVTAARGAEGLDAEARTSLGLALSSLQRQDGGFSGLDGRSDPYFSLFAWLSLRAVAAPFDHERLCAYMARGIAAAQAVDARCARILLVRERWLARWRAALSVAGALFRGEGRDAYGAFQLGLLGDAAWPLGLPRCLARLCWRRAAAGVVSARAPTPVLAARAVLAARGGVRDDEALGWLSGRRVSAGGYAAALGAPPDLLATAAALVAESLAPAGARMRDESLRRDLAFVEACWLEDGLFGLTPHAERGDAESTFYGLLALGACRALQER